MRHRCAKITWWLQWVIVTIIAAMSAWQVYAQRQQMETQTEIITNQRAMLHNQQQLLHANGIAVER